MTRPGVEPAYGHGQVGNSSATDEFLDIPRNLCSGTGYSRSVGVSRERAAQPDWSFPCARGSVSGPYSEPHESSAYIYLLFLEILYDVMPSATRSS
jgi:hypothetical protein